jgi:hypothetical protein
VKQSLLEVNKVDMENKCEGGWSVVEEGTLIMNADEAITRLATTRNQYWFQGPHGILCNTSNTLYR